MPRTRAPARRRATSAAHERTSHNAKAVSRLERSLKSAQDDLASLRGNLGRGAGDLRRDVARLLRDARRNATRMSRLVRRDLDRLQRDLAGAAGARRNGRGRGRGATRSRARATRRRAS
jgi:ABC-type transporter Mla subunit MlaD